MSRKILRGKFHGRENAFSCVFSWEREGLGFLSYVGYQRYVRVAHSALRLVSIEALHLNYIKNFHELLHKAQ